MATKKTLKELQDEMGIVPSPYTHTPPTPYPIWEMIRERPDWQKEPWDDLIPGEGFVGDFVAHTRGVETSTSFSIWTALFLISSVLRRDAWFKWIEGSPLLPNLYVVLVSPPGLLKKNTVMAMGRHTMESMPSYIQDPGMSLYKTVTTFTDSITPEGIRDVLTPTNQRVKYMDSEGEEIIQSIHKGSEVAFFVPELAVMLNRKRYNMGIIERLTSLYDGEDSATSYTRGGGYVNLKDLYVTLLGGATPDGLRDSFPEEAFGGGFMSRTMVIYEEYPTRFYPTPKRFEGIPSQEEAAKRLAWIAENAQGQYYLSEEATRLHEEWYQHWKLSLAHFTDDNEVNRQTRLDTIVLRLSTLIRAQRYEVGTCITAKDWFLAKAIAEKTLGKAGGATAEVGGGIYQKILNRCQKKLSMKGRVSRRELITSMSKYTSAEFVDKVIKQLHEMNLIRTENSMGRKTASPGYTNKDIYVWKGPQKDQDDDE